MGSSATSCIVFKRHEKLFRVNSRKMNEAGGVDEEAEYAERMGKEVSAILKCEKFSASMSECKQCHAIAESRRNAVRLIMKAQKFERDMNLAPYSQKAFIMAK